MSDPTTSKPGHSETATATGATKGHSPVVRIIEWVVIGALGLVVANEAYSKFSYDATFTELEKAIDAAEADGSSVSVDELETMISGMPTRTENKDGNKTEYDYRWRSLFKTYRILVNLSSDPDSEELVVLSFETDAPVEEPAPAVVDSGNVEVTMPNAPGGGPPMGQAAGGGESRPMGHAGAGGPQPMGAAGGGGPPGMPGGGGGRPQVGFATLDADGDGAIVIDELPRWMHERFPEMDTDGNGSVSEEEFDNRPQPGGGAESGRPELEPENGEGEEATPPADSESESEAEEATGESEESASENTDSE